MIMGKAKFIYLPNYYKYDGVGRPTGYRPPYKPRPKMAAYHASLTPEQKKELRRLIGKRVSEAYWSLPEEKRQEYIKKSAERTYEALYGTPAKRREMIEFVSYIHSHLKYTVSPERWAEIKEARRQGTIRHHQRRGEKKRKEWAQKVLAKRNKVKSLYIEEGVKRDNDYCGVVREAV